MKFIWEDKNGKIRISEKAVAVGLTIGGYACWRLAKKALRKKIPWI